MKDLHSDVLCWRGMIPRSTGDSGDYREAVLRRVQTIPAFPATANRLLEMLQEPDVSIQAVVRLAEHDPGLTSSVLRLANSVHFTGARSIGSLREAIVRLGTNQLLKIVLVSLTAPMAKQSIRGYDLAAGELLKHGIAVGVGAEALAEELGVKPPSHLLTASLLHDLGKIILGTFLEVDGSKIVEVAQRNKLSFEEAEFQVLGISHPEVGALLLQHWNVPLDVVEAVRFHHTPDAAPHRSLMVDLVHLADQLAIGAGIGAGIDGLQYRPCPAAVARTMFCMAAAEKTVCRMIEGLKVFEELIQLSVGGDSNGA